MQQNSYRKLKVANLVKSVLSEILIQGKGLELFLDGSFLSITNVVMSNDLKIANCYVRPFINDDKSVQDLMDALALSKKAIRKIMNSKLNLRYSPELRFFYDTSLSNAIEVEEKLRNSIIK